MQESDVHIEAEADGNPVTELQQPLLNDTAEDTEHQPNPSKRRRIINIRLSGYQFEEPSELSNYPRVHGNQSSGDSVQKPTVLSSAPVDQRSLLMTTYLKLLDNFVCEIDNRFGALQEDIAISVSATHPTSPSFMLKSALQPLADLADLVLDDTELELARRLFFTKNYYADAKSIAQSSVINSMPSVQKIIQLSRTIAVSTAACESSLSTLKRILTPHRMSMLHCRKADLILISFERQLAHNIHSDGQLLRRIWNSGPDCRRRLQLY